MSKPVLLFVASASPFARKCAVAVRERGLTGIEEQAVAALESPPVLSSANPLVQIPALIFEDGSTLFDSSVICAFLDTLGDAPPLAPQYDWVVRRREALGDGVCEMAVRLRFEQIRPDGEKSPWWQARWRENIGRALDEAEADADLHGAFDVGAIAWGCALGYLDLRHGDLDWRSGRPRLEAFHARLNARPSFIDTRP
jgi:glutathione S-transferase